MFRQDPGFTGTIPLFSGRKPWSNCWWWSVSIVRSVAHGDVCQTCGTVSTVNIKDCWRVQKTKPKLTMFTYWQSPFWFRNPTVSRTTAWSTTCWSRAGRDRGHRWSVTRCLLSRWLCFSGRFSRRSRKWQECRPSCSACRTPTVTRTYHQEGQSSDPTLRIQEGELAENLESYTSPPADVV